MSAFVQIIILDITKTLNRKEKKIPAKPESIPNKRRKKKKKKRTKEGEKENEYEKDITETRRTGKKDLIWRAQVKLCGRPWLRAAGVTGE